MENTTEIPKIPDIIVRDIHPDVHDILLAEQKNEKKKRGINQFSLSSTIQMIVRDWKRCVREKDSIK